MATTDLGKWMITNGGEYNPNTTYEQLTMVLYQNSTYITLRTVTGIIPNNDKINYILMAQGFSANALGDVVAKDTYGVIGDVGGDVSAQNLVDYLTNEVVNNLLKKTSISTVQANSDNTVPSSSLAYAMQQEITKNKEDIATANSNLVNLNAWSSSVTMREAEAITMPSNRFVLFFLNPSTTSGAYARISVDSNNNMIRLVAPSGEGVTQCVPIAKNLQIQATSISGGTLSYRFIGD